MTHTLYLNQSVSFCDCDGVTLFLNAGDDTYLRLTRDQTLWFEQIREAPMQSWTEPVTRFADVLLHRKILTRDETLGKRIQTETAASPGQLISLPSLKAPPWPRHIATLFYAVLVCSLTERARDFPSVVSAARRWKSKASGHAKPGADMAHLVAAFHALSPLFFSTRDACRYRSLCLLRFLTLYGLSPNWVFGVRLSPFQAHCWIEAEGYVLNDDAGNVQEYRRILTI